MSVGDKVKSILTPYREYIITAVLSPDYVRVKQPGDTIEREISTMILVKIHD